MTQFGSHIKIDRYHRSHLKLCVGGNLVAEGTLNQDGSADLTWKDPNEEVTDSYNVYEEDTGADTTTNLGNTENLSFNVSDAKLGVDGFQYFIVPVVSGNELNSLRSNDVILDHNYVDESITALIGVFGTTTAVAIGSEDASPKVEEGFLHEYRIDYGRTEFIFDKYTLEMSGSTSDTLDPICRIRVDDTVIFEDNFGQITGDDFGGTLTAEIDITITPQQDVRVTMGNQDGVSGSGLVVEHRLFYQANDLILW